MRDGEQTLRFSRGADSTRGRARPPRVAVIVPAYDAERYLAQALESVLAQTYSDWELIVADDASRDGTRAVAERYAKQDPDRIKVVPLERNVGPGRARNAAIAASSGGELVALLDADDYWRQDYLDHQVGLYDTARTAGLAVGIVACNPLIHGPGGVTGETFADRHGWRETIDYTSMIERSYVPAPLFVRAGFDEVGGFARELRGAEDYDLWLRLLEAGYEIVTTRESVYTYRHHPVSLSRDKLRMTEDAIAAYERALARDKLSAPQRRAIKRKLRHYHALRRRELVYEAIERGRPLVTIHRALRATPTGVVAFAQCPARWPEWCRALIAG